MQPQQKHSNDHQLSNMNILSKQATTTKQIQHFPGKTGSCGAIFSNGQQRSKSTDKVGTACDDPIVPRLHPTKIDPFNKISLNCAISTQKIRRSRRHSILSTIY